VQDLALVKRLAAMLEFSADGRRRFARKLA